MRIHKRFCTIQHIACNTDRRGAEQSVLRITGGIRILQALFNILNRYKPCKFSVLINKRKFFYLGRHQDLFRFFQRCAAHGGNQFFFWRHYIRDLNGIIRHKTHIAVCEDAHKGAVLLTDRNAADLIFAHQIFRILRRILRIKEKRIRNNAVFRSFNFIHFCCLILDRHILVYYADAALARNSDRHSGFRYGIHGRSHKRNIKLNIFC